MAELFCTQIANLTASPPVLADVGDVYGKQRIFRFTYTLLGTEAADDTIELARLYSGATVVPFGKVFWTDLGVDVDVSIGFAAYVSATNVSVSADPDAFLVATDMAAGVGLAQLEAPAGAGVQFFPKGNAGNEYVSIIATITDGGSIAPLLGGVIDGWLVVTEE